jgi:hypothetical protein
MMCSTLFFRAVSRLTCLWNGAVILALAASLPAAAATLTVGTPSYPTIGSAVTAAQNGDIVLVPDGTYTGPGNVDIDFQGKAITVQSVNGPASTVIDCSGTLTDPHGAFIFQSEENSNSVLQGFTIQNANQVVGNYGGAIAVYASSPTISQCDFVNNTGCSGGAIDIDDGSPWISQCVFSGNSATIGASNSNGGAIAVVTDSAYANPVLEDCVFLNNAADGDGGAIDLASYINADTTGISLVNCSFYGNTASGDGYTVDTNDEPGAIDFYQSTAVISNCIFFGDSSPTEISTLNPPNSPIVEDSDIVQAGYAGTHGNIDADPTYFDAAVGNLQLLDGSPCVGTGSIDGAPSVDIHGNSWGANVSMGAYAGSLAAQTTPPPAPTATQLIVTGPSSMAVGSPATMTVTAEDANGNVVTGYSGTVAFSSTDSAALLPTSSTLTSGVGSFSVTFNTAGPQTIATTDSADSLTGTSASIAVSKIATTTTVSSSLNPVAFGTAVTVTATVSLVTASTNMPTGTVSFSCGTSVLGSAPITAGQATLTLSRLPAGTDSLTAAYSGDTNFTDSVSSAIAQTVHAALHTFAPGMQMIAISENDAALPLSNVWNAPVGQSLATWAGGPNYPLGTSLPTPGQGAWVYLGQSATIYDVGTPTPTTQPCAISLQSGWNLIGNPFASAVAESGFSVQTAQGTATFASGQNAIYTTLYTYPAGASAYTEQGLTGGSLAPYQGYWMYAFAPCTLLIPPPAISPSVRP